MKKIKVAIYQSHLKGKIPENILKKISRKKPDFLALPEYFFFKKVSKLSDAKIDFKKNIRYLTHISRKLKDTVLIGGSMIREKNKIFYNTAFVFYQGRLIGEYDKQKLFGREKGDISTGFGNKVFEAKGIRFSVLICADILSEEIIMNLKTFSPQLVFLPTFSPYKEEKIEDKILRDENIFVKNAQILKTPIVKICGVSTPKLSYPIQGRSLIADPERIVWRTPFHLENKEILKIGWIKIEEK
ncbi:MAG: hypothetical protein A2Y41_01395 [Spirochaetes bacterium GWB1_36_13]|nr:MAG: hypothetical protein A2Y41_01395 [Spirochaetes bacterium GWB1_36_13]